MFVFTATITASLLCYVMAQTPPAFQPAVSTNLQVLFPNPGRIAVTPGTLVPITDTVSSPDFGILPSAATQDTYLAIMLDLDIPINKTTVVPFLHWMVKDLTVTTRNQLSKPQNSSNIAPYVTPAPPAGTGEHTYVLALFTQPANFAVPASFASIAPPKTESDRLEFNITKFMAAAHFSLPVAATNWKELNTTSAGEANSSGTASATGAGSTSTSTVSFTGAAQMVEVKLAVPMMMAFVAWMACA